MKYYLNITVLQSLTIAMTLHDIEGQVADGNRANVRSREAFR